MRGRCRKPIPANIDSKEPPSMRPMRQSKFPAYLLLHTACNLRLIVISQMEVSKLNKAGYTANTSADGWAGAEMRVFTLSNSITMTDGPTDRWTNGWTDGRTKPLRVACPQLKSESMSRVYSSDAYKRWIKSKIASLQIASRAIGALKAQQYLRRRGYSLDTR